MEPLTFQGDAVSEYFCTKLLWSDPQLRGLLDPEGADVLYKKASSLIRYAQRQLRDRDQARSTYTLLLRPLAELLEWQLGETEKIATEEGLEEGGLPLLSDSEAGPIARAVCIAPDAHLEAAPAGLHRRFAPSFSLARVLKDQGLDYGFVANAFELRLMCCIGTLPSHIGFDLSAIAEGTRAGLEAWKLLYNLLRQNALVAKPRLIDRIREIGREHQQRVSTDLGHQVQQAVVRFMQGVLDHPDNKGRLPGTITDEFLHDLYQETLRLLYRLLFTFYAEDLGLLPIDMLTYREGYSLKRLVQLARQTGTQRLEESDPNGSFFQDSLQALFALLRHGVNLGPEGKIEPYGGGLFDPENTKLIASLQWGNATIDHVIEYLVEVPAPKGYHGKVRLSYRELNVEQLGSIYEGLLEVTPSFAREQQWRVKLDNNILVIDDDMRRRLADKRGEVLTDDRFRKVDAVEQDDDDEDDDEEENDEVEVEAIEEAAEDDGDNDADEAGEADDELERPSSNKPMRVVQQPIMPGTVYLKSGLGRKQSGSYYTNRAFVDFLVREAVDPHAKDKTANEILSLRCADLAMGSGHFLVGVCRRLAEHLLSAYRREVAKIKAQDEKGEFTEDDLLLRADIPDDLCRAWNSPDQERELAVCRLLVAGNCIYGVDKNPLAVDLAKTSLWLITAASRQPLTFLDHRLRCGDSLLGLPAEELVAPYIPRKVKAGKWADYPSLLTDREQVDAGLFTQGREKLCAVLCRAFGLLGVLRKKILEDRANFEGHRVAHLALVSQLRPFWQLHQTRVGLAFRPVRSDRDAIDVPNRFLDALCLSNGHHIPDEVTEAAQPFITEAERLCAFCWEIAFPEVFYNEDGTRRDDAGFDILVGNPPWDKVKPAEKEFYGQYDPTIIDFQGQVRKQLVREIDRRIPEAGPAWDHYKLATNLYKEKLVRDGVYRWQQDKIPNEKTGRDKTTGGDPDLFKFFAERFFQLAAPPAPPLTKGGQGGVAGRVGILIPAAFYAAEGSKGLRRMVLENARIQHLYSYENRRGIFPSVDTRFKFCAFVVAKASSPGASSPSLLPDDEFPAAFMLHDPAFLDASPAQQAGRVVKLSPKFIREQSPTHLSFFEFRSEQEKALVQRIYDQFPPLGKQLDDTWNVSFTTELHMTQDSWLFRERDRLRQFGGTQHRGEYWTLPEKEWFERQPDKFVWVTRTESELRGKASPLAKGGTKGGRGRTRGGRQEPVFDGVVLKEEEDERSPQIMVPGNKYVPLYEGRMVHQFDHAAKAYVSGSGRKAVWRDLGWDEKESIPHYFVAALQFDKALPDRRFARAGFCDVTGQTNERSALCALIPADAACGNKVPTLSFDGGGNTTHLVWLWMANSFIIDWLLRQRISTTINFFYWHQTSMPRLSAESVGSITALVDALTHEPAQNEGDRANRRAELDALAAQAYGVSASELAALLATFPLLDRDQPWLPGDGFIAYDKKGRSKLKPRSFITRDKVLLEYFRLLGETPPNDIVAFFAEAGVNIDGGKVLAGEPPADPFNPPICATGPIRNLEERVRLAEEELGAIAYVPTVRKRPTEEALARIRALERRVGLSVGEESKNLALDLGLAL